MRLPQRRSQSLRDTDTTDDVIELTPASKAKLEAQLERLERVDRPALIEVMQFALSLGDFSENAEYQDAKWKLARLETRVLTIKDRLKRARIVHGDDDVVSVGSFVLLRTNNKERRYQVVGPHEANPSLGRLSRLSPVGSAILGKRVGDMVTIEREDDAPLVYEILAIERDDSF